MSKQAKKVQKINFSKTLKINILHFKIFSGWDWVGVGNQLSIYCV